MRGLLEPADESVRATARWVALLWLAAVLLQRFTLPGSPVPLLLLVTFAWLGWGLRQGLLELDRERTLWWIAAASSGAAAVSLQLLVVPFPKISPTSWGLFMAVWLPFVLRLTDRRLSAYREALRRIALISAALAAAAVVMMLSQLLGLPYRDWLAMVVPSSFLYSEVDFVITYPISYGSPIYRANAWIGLEPSFVSAQIGLGLVAAVLVGMRRRVVLVQLLGLVCATSGSGFVLAGVGLLVLAVHPARTLLARYVGLGVLAVLVGSLTPFGRALFSRVTEVNTGRSSTSLRTVLPYQEIWPRYVDSALGVLIGRGPGSSQDEVAGTGIVGLLVPTPIKIFYDYGLVAGAVIAGFLILCVLRGPSRSLAFTLFFSLWTLQPGTTTTLIVLPVLLLVTLWSPRGVAALECRSSPGAVVRRGPPEPVLVAATSADLRRSDP